MSQSSLQSFQRHLQAMGKRPGTQESYVSCVARLITHAGVPADSITSDHAYGFLIDRGNALGVSASWYNVIFNAVVRWFEMRGVPLEVRGLRPKRVALQPPRWFTAEVVRQVIAAEDDRRFRLAYQVMFATGMRVSELTAMRVEDIDRERPIIRIPCGKGGDGRLVTMAEPLRQRLRDYWKTLRPCGVFFQRRPGHDDRSMQASTLGAAFKRAAKRAGVKETVSLHRLRHSFAIHSLRNGMDLVKLQRLMGHRSIHSTVRYLTPDLDRPVGSLIDLLTLLEIKP